MQLREALDVVLDLASASVVTEEMAGADAELAAERQRQMEAIEAFTSTRLICHQVQVKFVWTSGHRIVTHAFWSEDERGAFLDGVRTAVDAAAVAGVALKFEIIHQGVKEL